MVFAMEIMRTLSLGFICSFALSMCGMGDNSIGYTSKIPYALIAGFMSVGLYCLSLMQLASSSRAIQNPDRYNWAGNFFAIIMYIAPVCHVPLNQGKESFSVAILPIVFVVMLYMWHSATKIKQFLLVKYEYGIAADSRYIHTSSFGALMTYVVMHMLMLILLRAID
jgi:hypothetical protein